MVTNDTLISAAALRDYRDGTAMLREALECRLADALPSNTREIAVWGIDAVTPVLVDAARRLRLHVCAIYVTDETMAGDTYAGIPIVNAQNVSTGGTAITVLTSCTPTDLAAVGQKIASERIVELVERSADLPNRQPEPVMTSHLAEARSLRDQGRLKEAFAVYQMHAMWADATSTVREMADLAFGIGRVAAALRLYRRVRRRYPEDPALVMYRIASMYKQLGQHDRSRSWFARVLAVPGVAPALQSGSHFHLGGICLEQGDRAGAASQFRDALRASPDHGKAKELLDALAA